jgi:hypothetical protein
VTKIITIYSERHGKHDVLVDDEDYERVVQGTWHISTNGSVYSTPFYAIGRVNGDRQIIKMHRFILGLRPGDLEVHHKNGDGLDNRKENLEPITSSKHSVATWESKNPQWVYKDRNRYVARVTVMCAKVHLGRFDTKEEAIAAVQEYLKCNPR